MSSLHIPRSFEKSTRQVTDYNDEADFSDRSVWSCSCGHLSHFWWRSRHCGRVHYVPTIRATSTLRSHGHSWCGRFRWCHAVIHTYGSTQNHRFCNFSTVFRNVYMLYMCLAQFPVNLVQKQKFRSLALQHCSHRTYCRSGNFRRSLGWQKLNMWINNFSHYTYNAKYNV